MRMQRGAPRPRPTKMRDDDGSTDHQTTAMSMVGMLLACMNTVRRVHQAKWGRAKRRLADGAIAPMSHRPC